MKVPIYEPLNTLKKVDYNIWIVDGDSIKMDFVLFDVPFSTRMTVVKLRDGTLWCHSPIKPTNKLLRDIRKLGEVRHLVSPNKLHYAFIGEWKKISQMRLPGKVPVLKPELVHRISTSILNAH